MDRGRLLILDDDATVGQTLLSGACACGVDGRLSASVAEFLAEHDRWLPTLVAIDLRLQGECGGDVLPLLAERRSTAAVIVCSGAGEVELAAALARAQALGLRCAGPLAKPFRLAALKLLLSPPGLISPEAAAGTSPKTASLRTPGGENAAMPLDTDAAYLALKARDARFDGRLFVGVTSTGIYCRPVCRVRTPRQENCRFFASRERAEAARFRPCLKCRPEIAPGLSAMDSSQALADHAARAIEQAVHSGQPLPLPALASRLGVTDRHLRRIFSAAHGVSPLAWLTTQRLLLAKQLLTDTTMPVTQVALASGFESLRRFNAAFVEHYRFSPTRLRREGAPARRPGLRLAWRPPLDIEALLGFFERRQMAGIEQVDGLALRRTLAWPAAGGAIDGWIEARFEPGRHELHLSTSDSLAPVLGALMQRVRAVFDLDAEPARIDPVLALLPVPPRPGHRLPGCFDGFETAVRVILGQQVTVKAARTLTARLVERFGRPLDTPFPGLDRVFPDAATLAAADPAAIGTLGIVRQRVKALQALAAEVAAGRIDLQPGAPLAPTLAALTALPGIGDWTAQVIAMRALAWPDAWPASDIGLMNALGTRKPAELTTLAEPWRPWRAYAVMRLWHFTETGT